MEKTLLYLLACPLCKGDLHYLDEHEEIICGFDRLAFPIIDGVPVMLETRARRLSVDEVADLKK